MSHVQVEPKALKTVGCVGVFLVTDARSATVDLLIGSGSIRGAFPLPALAPQGRPGNWTSCSGASKLAPIGRRLRSEDRVRAAVRSTAHRSVVASFQKRNRNPTVGAMLLCWRKPEANPPFTCVNMIPE